jgi:hypothetical protein
LSVCFFPGSNAGLSTAISEQSPSQLAEWGVHKTRSLQFENSIANLPRPPPGHYDSEAWDPQSQRFQKNDNVAILITVEEVFDNNHRVVSQRGASKGRLTFTAADSGDHRICFTAQNVPHNTGWLSSGHAAGGVKFTLDLAIGETSQIESSDKGKIDDIVSRVKDLNQRLQDIRREQVFQRVCLCFPFLLALTFSGALSEERGVVWGLANVAFVYLGARGRVP